MDTCPVLKRDRTTATLQKLSAQGKMKFSAVALPSSEKSPLGVLRVAMRYEIKSLIRNFVLLFGSYHPKFETDNIPPTW